MEQRRPARGVQQHGHNLALVAGLVARDGPVSRAELARRCGLTKTTVTQLTGELADGGLIRELGVSRAGGPGRPAHLLVLNSSGPAGIGLQIEADHVAGCLLDLTGRVRDRAIRRVGDLRGDPARAFKAAEPVLRRLLHTADTGDTVVAGVAVGVPGRVTEAGEVHTTELRWPTTAVSRLLARRLAALSGGVIPVTTHDGHHLAARAEQWFTPVGTAPAHPGPEHRTDGEPSAVEAAESVLYVGGELSLGAAFVASHGGTGTAPGAADFGHVRLRRQGKRCGCGRRGCLDTVAGSRALRGAAGTCDPVASRLVGGDGPLPGLLRRGDEAATAAVHRATTALAEALAGPVTLLDPDVVVLGGYLGVLGDGAADAVARDVARRCPRPVRVRPSRLGGDAVARAAAMSVTRGLLDDPAGWLAP